MPAIALPTRLRSVFQTVVSPGAHDTRAVESSFARSPKPSAGSTLEIAPNDPLVAYFQSAPTVVEIDKLALDSPALRSLKAAGVKLAVPLVSQGELIGLLNLGPRLSEQEYSADDRALLNNLATQAAPAVRVAQLVQRQQLEARERERIEQELRVARHIQHTLLPKEVPSLPGWQLAAYYQPARAVGGDFYDFLPLPDGSLGLVVGDVTDKGVPAALLMATTRSILRAAGQRLTSPGEVLERVNDLLCPDIPPKMFVTCLYAILDPSSGRLRYANAGQDLPYRRHVGGVSELRATGMPLGLMPGMRYDEVETTLAHGETVLFYSDGLVEAHNPERDMFSFPRLRGLMAGHTGGVTLIETLLEQLAAFTGPGWEQEDDVTLVTLERCNANGDGTMDHSPTSHSVPHSPIRMAPDRAGDEDGWTKRAEFSVPSEPGNERLAMKQVAEAIEGLSLSPTRRERLGTAVSEATMNAMEHGNKYRPESPVQIQVLASPTAVMVQIVDEGGAEAIAEPKAPDLEAKLAGDQSARGWGLFLIKAMVDEMRVTADGVHHTVELILNLEGDEHGDKTL